MRRILASILAFLLLPQLVLAYTNPGQPKGFVNDFAQMLDPSLIPQIETELVNFESETKHEIAVVTIPSLEGDTIENYAVKLFEDWKIGKKGADNGVLFLISRDDRKMRIEVGYGLEGALPDATAHSIITQITTPAFKQGDYGTGVVKTVQAIESAVRGEDVSSYLPPPQKVANQFWDNLGVLFFIFIFVFLRLLIFSFGNSKRWWPGGVWGFGFGLLGGLLMFGFSLGLLWIILLFSGLGLGLDFVASKKGPFNKGGRGGGPWFLGGGGFGGGSGGGFGGFGGGGSGGGGSSGGW